MPDLTKSYMSPADILTIARKDVCRVYARIWAALENSLAIRATKVEVVPNDRPTKAVRGLGPNICVNYGYERFKEAYLRAEDACTKVIVQSFNDSLRRFVFEHGRKTILEGVPLGQLHKTKWVKDECYAVGSARAVHLFNAERYIDATEIRIANLGGDPIPPRREVRDESGYYDLANPDYFEACYEVLMLIKPGAVVREIPEELVKRSEYGQAYFGELDFHYQVDGDCNLFGEYGRHKYQLLQTYRVADPEGIACYIIPRKL